MSEDSFPAESNEDPLELVSAVFICSCQTNYSLISALFGWQDVDLHLSCFIPLDIDSVLEEATLTSGVSYSVAGYVPQWPRLGLLNHRPAIQDADE